MGNHRLRRLILRRTMRPDDIVLFSPFLDKCLGLKERGEYFSVKKLISDVLLKDSI